MSDKCVLSRLGRTCNGVRRERDLDTLAAISLQHTINLAWHSTECLHHSVILFLPLTVISTKTLQVMTDRKNLSSGHGCEGGERVTRGCEFPITITIAQTSEKCSRQDTSHLRLCRVFEPISIVGRNTSAWDKRPPKWICRCSSVTTSANNAGLLACFSSGPWSRIGIPFQESECYDVLSSLSSH